MSRRLVALAALAVVVGCAGCDAADFDSAKSAATSAGDQVTSDTADKLKAQLDAKTAEATAAAKQAAADLTAQAQKAVQDQIAAAVKQAADAAVQTAASAAASAAPSPVAVVSSAPVVAETTHTVSGTYTSAEVVDVSAGSVPCATLTNVVGQEVRISTGTDTVTGQLTSCTWSAPGVLGSSPVFAFEVQRVPEATSYDVSVGDRTWKVSGTTLAASGWKVALT